MCYLKADREWSTTGKRLEPGMVPPGIIQNREWPDREWSDREWSTTETRLGEIRLTEVRGPGKGLLPFPIIFKKEKNEEIYPRGFYRRVLKLYLL